MPRKTAGGGDVGFGCSEGGATTFAHGMDQHGRFKAFTKEELFGRVGGDVPDEDAEALPTPPLSAIKRSIGFVSAGEVEEAQSEDKDDSEPETLIYLVKCLIVFVFICLGLLLGSLTAHATDPKQ